MNCNTFLGSRLKVDRAKKHIVELNNEIIDYIRSKPYRVVVEQKANSPNHLWTLRVRHQVPESFAAIIGDVIHNLRSSLDLLASELVGRAGESTDKVYFPFGNDIDGFEDMVRKRHIDRAGEDVVQIIRSLKPYKGGNDLLRAIHDLDITDKHKTLIPSLHHVGIKDLRVVSNNGPLVTIKNFRCGPIKDGMVLLSMPPANNVKVGQYFQPSLEIAFAETQPLHGEPVLNTMHKFCQLTTSIIDVFDAHVFKS